MADTLRIFIGLREVAGYYGNLKSGFDKLNIPCAFMNLGGNRFAYSEGKNPRWVQFFNKIGHYFGKHFSRSFFLRMLWLMFFQNLFSLFALFIAVFRYNVFILGSNSTFFFFLELPLLKLLKKKLIYIFLGTDSRPVYLNGYVMNKGKHPVKYILIARLQKWIISIIERFADYRVNHPPQAHFHEKSFISLLCLGIPFDTSRIRITEIPQEKETVKVLHVPSKAKPKGSRYFAGIMRKFQEQGWKVDYEELTGLSNSEVLKKIQECDFVIDELYSDTPMAVFATEAAFCGKPAVVGSYYADYLRQDIPEACIPPSVFCLPEDIEKMIEQMLGDKNFRTTMGNRAHEFVMNHWKAEKVAANYLELINDRVPASWIYPPEKLRYPYGCGLSKQNVAANVNAILRKGGKKALRLSHNPELEQIVIDIVKTPR